MSAQRARLTARMREVQWALDDAAYRMPRGEVSEDKLENLADQLVALAHLLRSDGRLQVVAGDVIPVIEQ